MMRIPRFNIEDLENNDTVCYASRYVDEGDHAQLEKLGEQAALKFALPALALEKPDNVVRIGLRGSPASGKSTFSRAFRMAHEGSKCTLGGLLIDHYESESGGQIIHYDARRVRLAAESDLPPELQKVDVDLTKGIKSRNRGGFELVEHANEDPDKYYDAIVSISHLSEYFRRVELCISKHFSQSKVFTNFMDDAALNFDL